MKKISLLITLLIVSCALFGQYKSNYPDIPIVDVHYHPTGVHDVSNLIKVGDVVKQKYGSNLTFWIGLTDLTESVAEVKAAGKNRILFAVSEMRPHKGLKYPAEEVIAKVRDGYVGSKFWFGDPHRVLEDGERGITLIDDIRYEDFFSKLERANVLMTSLHIADPNGPFDNRQRWMADPVYYWKQIRAFENVVAKYPKLTIIAAHCAWLVCQDAQIDYLRYMLSTYPNLYIDISATFQYMPLVNRENLRNFYIEYQDRILFGTDGGSISDNAIQNVADRYANTFEILETARTVNWGANRTIQGLELPKEVLEKLYYKNALKLYPGLKAAMGLQ